MKKALIVGFCAKDIIQNKSFFGGAAGGICLNLSKLNVNTGILSVLGNDLFSKKYLKEFKKNNIDTSLLYFSKNPIPQMKVIDDNGKELGRYYNDFGNIKFLAQIKPQKGLISNFDFMHVVNTPKNLCDFLADNLKGEISYSPGGLFVRDKSSLSINLLSRTNFLFLNEEEFNLLKKKIDVLKLFINNLKMVCLTLGSRGVRIITKDKSAIIKTKKAKVIDTTGAGDAIVVGFIKEYFKGSDYESGIKEGMRLASVVVGKLGGQIVL